MYSIVIAYLLWILSGFGWAGFHRFYLGKIGTGLLWMLTGGMFGIGSLYDLFTLPRQVEEANIRRNLARGFGTSPGSIPGRVRPVQDGETRIVPDPYHEKPEQVILKIARRKKGIVTPSDVSLETGLSLDDAKKELDNLVAGGFAELRVRTSGGLVYTIPDFLDPDAPLESL